jgi:hypothetical protein
MFHSSSSRPGHRRRVSILPTHPALCGGVERPGREVPFARLIHRPVRVLADLRPTPPSAAISSLPGRPPGWYGRIMAWARVVDLLVVLEDSESNHCGRWTSRCCPPPPARRRPARSASCCDRVAAAGLEGSRRSRGAGPGSRTRGRTAGRSPPAGRAPAGKDGGYALVAVGS